MKSALEDILGSVLDHPHITTSLILFNNRAVTLDLNKTNYGSKVTDIKAQGGTDFACALEHLGKEISKFRDEAGKTI